jgi:2-oxoglutarate dehydrogenase E2 component (dihydrolipoamide succinyltransferase)
MNDDHPTPGSDEELSAALDGELDAERAAALAADPATAARLEQLAAVAAAVAAPVPPLPAATVDDLIAGALEAPVAPAAPAGGRRGPSPLLVAAAITLLVAIGLGLVWSGRDDGATADLATSEQPADEASEASAGADAGDGTAERSTGDGATEEGFSAESGELDSTGAPEATSTAPATGDDAAELVDLGAFPDGDALRAALAAAFPTAVTAPGAGDGTEAPTALQVDRCGEQLQVTLELGAGPQRTGFATVGDAQVLVYEFAAPSFVDASPTTLVAAVGVEACEQVVFFER